jgi:hypothetical protein
MLHTRSYQIAANSIISKSNVDFLTFKQGINHKDWMYFTAEWGCNHLLPGMTPPCRTGTDPVFR